MEAESDNTRASLHELSSFLRLTWDVYFFMDRSRPVNGCTTGNQSVTDSGCIYTETNAIEFISHVIVPRHYDRYRNNINPMQPRLDVRPFTRW